MKIKVREIGDVVEVAVEGNVLQENVNLFKNRIIDLIDNGKTKIILNLVDTSYISSLCLAVIVNAKKRLVAKQGDIKIALVNQLVKNLLEITNLVKKVELYESVDDAVASFSSKKE
ncbi:MAG TPA: STAS domain-containing protein [Chitinispirillaceae bacterium]|nr:STAS domain-containing protein [Chitinispirillaceae bacterium]